MARLHISHELMKAELVKTFRNVLEKYKEKLIQDIKGKLVQNLAKRHGEVKVEIKEISEHMYYYIYANAEVLMDAYGTGSKMDTVNNALIDEYINGESWNQYRSKSDTTIRGRKAGTYTDVFGNQKESKGNFARLPMEGRIIPNFENDGEGYIQINPIAPSKAIEEGIYYFVKECVPMIWNETVQQMDFSKCFVYK